MPTSISEKILRRNRPGATLFPIFDRVRTGAEHFAMPIAAQHRSGRRENSGNAGAGRAQQQAGRRLVAAAHQDDAVDRMGADQFLGLHREEIAIQHGRRLDVGLRQRERRQLDGKPARLQDAAFDVLDAGLEMRMALGEVGPGVDDADEGLAGIISRRIAHLVHARALPERAQVVAREPTGGAQVFGSFPRHGGLVVSRSGSASMVIGKQPNRSWPASAGTSLRARAVEHPSKRAPFGVAADPDAWPARA